MTTSAGRNDADTLVAMLNGLLEEWQKQASAVKSTERGPIDWRAGIEHCADQLRLTMRAYLEHETMGALPAARPEPPAEEQQ